MTEPEIHSLYKIWSFGDVLKILNLDSLTLYN